MNIQHRPSAGPRARFFVGGARQTPGADSWRPACGPARVDGPGPGRPVHPAERITGTRP